MTGTAATDRLPSSTRPTSSGVVPIPTNMPMIRLDDPDVVYKTEEAKFAAVVEDIAEKNEAGQAGAGRHRLGRQERVPLDAAAPARHPARGPQCQAARPRGRDRRPGGAQGRRHGGHQHGRPRHRHHARRQPGVHRRRRPSQPRPVTGQHAGGVRGGVARCSRSRPRPRSPASTRRWSRPEASTSWAPSDTSRAASTTSCEVAPAARATRASPASTCRSATT